MFREYEVFTDELSTMNERTDKLQAELNKMVSDKAAAEAKYERMMEEDATGEAIHTIESLNKAKKKIADLEAAIQLAQERIDAIIRARSTKAKELFPIVEDGWRHSIASVRDELLKHFEAMKEHRAKLMLAVYDAHQIYKKAEDLTRMLNDASRVVDPDSYSYRNLPISHYLPDDTFSGQNRGVIPTVEELNRVYTTGWLPEWVKHYAETGEIVSSEALKPQKTVAPASEKKEDEIDPYLYTYGATYGSGSANS